MVSHINHRTPAELRLQKFLEDAFSANIHYSIVENILQEQTGLTTFQATARRLRKRWKANPDRNTHASIEAVALFAAQRFNQWLERTKQDPDDHYPQPIRSKILSDIRTAATNEEKIERIILALELGFQSVADEARDCTQAERLRIFAMTGPHGSIHAAQRMLSQNWVDIKALDAPFVQAAAHGHLAYLNTFRNDVSERAKQNALLGAVRNNQAHCLPMLLETDTEEQLLQAPIAQLEDAQPIDLSKQLGPALVEAAEKNYHQCLRELLRTTNTTALTTPPSDPKTLAEQFDINLGRAHALASRMARRGKRRQTPLSSLMPRIPKRLRSQFPPEIRFPSPLGEALQKAAEKGAIESLRILLASRLMNRLTDALIGSACITAAKRGHRECLEALLATGRIASQERVQVATEAAPHDHLAACLAALLQGDRDCQIKAPTLGRILKDAAVSTDVSAIEAVLNHPKGPSISAQNLAKALTLAAKQGRPEAMRRILEMEKAWDISEELMLEAREEAKAKRSRHDEPTECELIITRSLNGESA